MSRMAMIYGFILIVGLIGVTYTYWLQEIELDGTVNDYSDMAVAQGSTDLGVTTYRVFVPMILK